LNISFATKRLEKLCNSHKEAVKKLGKANAVLLADRLASLASISKLNEARHLPGRFHALSGDRRGEFSLYLSGGQRLVVRPSDVPLPRLNDKSIDLSQVESVEVTFIGDYHG
jgi:toxin HigB-1